MELGEKLSYKFTLDEAYRKNNTKATRELESIGESPYKDLCAAGIQRKWLAKFNGETYKGTSLGTIYKNISIRDLGPLDLLAIISCMDTRLIKLLPAALGLKNGDAKIIKNAGSVISHPFGSVM